MGFSFPRRLQWPHWGMAALLLYGGWFVLATAVAAWRAYTPVPVWDMWHYVDFLYGVATGSGWQLWWSQMNEHRLVWTRALFWIEHHAFGGHFIFLIAINYLLALTSLATLHAYLRDRAPMTPLQTTLSWVVMGAWLLSWVQQENLAWAFQSQFFLAQLLPLLGLFSLYRATRPDAHRAWFPAACALGVASIGTMISGIMALPMLLLYAVLQRMGWRRIGVLIALTAACLTIYLTGYASPKTHGSVLATLQQDPLGMVHYALQYLGSPFQWMANAPASMWIGQHFGVLFVALVLHPAAKALRTPRAHALELSLLAFIAYVAGIAFATAGGRLQFGLASAVSSRYTTPTMMAWAALAILYWPTLIALRGKARALAAALLAVLLWLMISVQMQGTRRTEVAHLRMTGALALLLEVHDARRTGMLIWDEVFGMRLARLGAEQRIGLYGRPPLAGEGEALGRQEKVPPATCHGTIDSVEPVPEDPRFMLVNGALLPDGPPVDAYAPAPPSIYLVQTDGTVAGIGLTDRWRKRHVAGSDSPRVRHLTFTAYLRAFPVDLPAPMVLTVPGTSCSVPLTVPAPP